jgi:putative DNA primase/helicase
VHSLAGLDLEYSPEAACPDFLAFLESGLAEADIELLQRYCGGLLLGRNRYQVILLLLGTSGAGKGTLVELMSRLVGRVNTAELRANKLEERFEISSFAGKKLLIGPEVPHDIFSDRGCGQLKALVGGDLMNPEVKRKQERAGVKGDFHVILHTNSIQQQPWNADLAAFQRRLLVVTYNKPAPTTSIPDLADTLWTKEAPGILNWAVEGAVKLKQDGFVLTPEQKQRIELIVSPQPVPTLDSSSSPTLSRFQQFVAAVRAWLNREKQF